MSNKIKYNTERNGEFIELPLNCTRLVLPNGSEFTIRYDAIHGGLEVIKCYGTDDDDSITVKPGTSNKIIVK
jgi:hypothetical protein